MFQEGQQIGLYTLIQKLGQGGFGEVWLAENRTNSPIQKVAIKLPLHNQIDLNAVKEEIFNWTVSGRHKNILPIIECEVFENQIAIVSEFAPDGSLKDLLNKKGCLPIADAIEIVIGILNGLAHLHKRKIIHRDLKPDNILFQGNTPRLTDFGIARAMPQDSLSQLIAGTSNYMAVESFVGIRNEKTDIFSLGVILYQTLTNKFPYLFRKEIMKAVITENETLLRQYKDELPQPLPDKIPSALKDIVKKSLAKEPNKRYQTSDEMCQELKIFLKNFIEQVNTISDEAILFQNIPVDNFSTLSPTEPSPIQPSPTFEEKILPAENQSTLTEIRLLQNKKRKEDTEKQSTINEILQSEIKSIESDNQIFSVLSEEKLTEEKERLRIEFAKLSDELGELQLLGYMDSWIEEDFVYIFSEEGLRHIKEDIEIGRNLLDRINRLKPEADRLGIPLPKEFSKNEETVIEFEKKVAGAVKNESSNSLKNLQTEAETPAKNENTEVKNQQQAKSRELLKRVGKIEQTAFNFKIPLPDKLNLTEKIVFDFEKQVAEAKEKAKKSENTKAKKTNNVSATVPTNPPHDYKRTLRVIFFTPIMLSGIVFVFWYFEPIRPLFPSKIPGLWLIAMILGLAVGAAEDEEIPIIIKFIGVNLVYLIGLGTLFGVNYLANPNKTMKVYDDTIKILGLKRESNQQNSPLDYRYPFNRQNRIQFPISSPNTNVNTAINTSPNTNTQANISSNTIAQSNLQLKNSNTPIILGKTPSAIYQDRQNNNLKKSIDNELEKRGLKESIFHNVNVEVNTFYIKLSGLVKDLNSRNDAIRIANQKKGDRFVNNGDLRVYEPILRKKDSSIFNRP
jgi:serine/threonine protein kinase